MPKDNRSRRSVLKTAAAGSALSVTPAAVSAHEKDLSETEADINGTVKSTEDAAEDVEAILGEEKMDELVVTIEDDSGFQLNDEKFVSIEIETDDEELNKHDPAITYLPIMPSEGEYTPDSGGALLAMTASEYSSWVPDWLNRRVPLLALGITRDTDQPAGDITAQSTNHVNVKAFGSTDTGPGVIEAATDTPVATDGTISAQPAHSNVSCPLCTTIFAAACAGSAALSIQTCASAAVSAGAFSPWAGGAAAAFCTYVVSNASGVTCAAAPYTICAAAGICPVTS